MRRYAIIVLMLLVSGLGAHAQSSNPPPQGVVMPSQQALQVQTMIATWALAYEQAQILVPRLQSQVDNLTKQNKELTTKQEADSAAHQKQAAELARKIQEQATALVALGAENAEQKKKIDELQNLAKKLGN